MGEHSQSSQILGLLPILLIIGVIALLIKNRKMRNVPQKSRNILFKDVLKSGTDVPKDKVPRNPGVAAVLSFFWAGLGQVYTGQFAQAVLLIVSQMFLGILFFSSYNPIFIIIMIIVWVYAIRNAYKGALSLNENIIQVSTDLVRKCPYCAEMIRIEAIKCRFCGESFDPNDVAKQVAEFKSNDNLENRVLCSDCACVGVIGADGKCKECGKLY